MRLKTPEGRKAGKVTRGDLSAVENPWKLEWDKGGRRSVVVFVARPHLKAHNLEI